MAAVRPWCSPSRLATLSRGRHSLLETAYVLEEVRAQRDSRETSRHSDDAERTIVDRAASLLVPGRCPAKLRDEVFEFTNLIGDRVAHADSQTIGDFRVLLRCLLAQG